MTTTKQGHDGARTAGNETSATRRAAGPWFGSGLRAAMRIALAAHRGLYRASRGRLGGSAKGVPLALLTTRGRKTGRSYTWPVGYVEDGEGLVLVASAGGQPWNPGWYYNLCADPHVLVEIRGGCMPMIAEPLTGSGREHYWEFVTRQHPAFLGYQRKVTRQIPVVLLRPDN